MNILSDKEVLLGIKNRDSTVFKYLFDIYFEKMVHFAEFFLYDTDEAKDVVQDTFVDLWERHLKIQHIKNLKSYLFVQVKNRALNRIRHLNIVDKNKEWIVEALLFAEVADVEFDVETHAKIVTLIEKLPEQSRNVFQLCVIDGCKYKEVAEQLGISVNTVNTHIKRAYKFLRANVNVTHAALLLFFWNKLS